MQRSIRPARASGYALALVVLALAAPAVAQAARYASPSGSGTCTQASPCSLQTAISGASAGDDINVIADQGDFALGSDIVTSAGTPLHFHGINGRPRLIFSGGGLRLNSGTAEDLYVQGNGPSTAFALDKSVASAERIIAKSGNVGHACYLDGATLTNSLCWAGASGDFAVETDGSPTLRNVTAFGGTEAAVLYYGRNPDCGCTTATATLVNVIARAAPGGVDLLGNSDNTANADVNVSYSNYATTGSTGAGAPSKVHVIAGAGNQTTAPSFVNAAAGDFHEAASSVTVDAGITDAANGTGDLDASPRTAGVSTDIGAYELPDTIAPETTITKAPKKKLTKSTAKFKFTSNEPGSTFECRLKGKKAKKKLKKFRPCSSPTKYKKLKPGKYKFFVRATDLAGNVDATPAKAKFKRTP